MKRFLSIPGLWLMLMILSMPAHASAEGKFRLVVGGDHENPPYEFLENGKPTGFNVELIKAVADAVGAEVEFRLGPWDKVRKELEQGKIDALAGMYYSKERSKAVDFSIPHTMVSAGLFVRNDSSIRSMEDIKDKEVIVQKGDVIDDYLREKGITSRIVEVTDPADELSLLASGKHDCALMPARFQGEYLKQLLGLSNIRAIAANLPQLRYCFAVRKGNNALLYRLDEGLDILKVNGKYKQIYQKWFGVYEKKSLWQTLRYFVWALALFAILLAANFIWSWFLRREVRKRTADLRESEEKFRVLANTSPTGIWLYQGERIVYVNPATARILEYTEDECLGMRFWDWVHDDYKDLVRERGMARQRGEPVPSQYECRHVTKNGKDRWALVSAGLIEYRGKPAGIVTMFDITERKSMEEELHHAYDDLEKKVKERTAELRRAKELLEEEISVRNRTERVITARLRLQEIAAFHSLDDLLEATIDEAEALTGSTIGFYHFLEPDQETLILQNWSTRTKAEFCRAEGKGPHYNVSAAGVWVDCVRERRAVIHNDYASLPHRKGMPPDHAVVIRELVLPVFRGDSIVAIVGVGNKLEDYTNEDIEMVSFLADLAWEIAERKQAEEALRLSQFCIDKAGIGIYQSDEQGTIFSVNEYACEQLGYSREELCALSVFDIDPEITPDRMLELKEMIDETGSMTHFTTHRRRDGSTFPVEITANNLDFRGKRYGISFVKDITERSCAEEQLRESESRVRRKLESILDPEGDIGELDLADIINVPAIQALMNDLYRASGLKMSILDLKGGAVLIDVGWQEICRKYHRGHPEAQKKCLESDTILTEGISPGEFRKYRCRNNMWHLVTPIIVGGRHMGNLFMSQFLYEGEEIDYDLFRAQAREYGYPEEEYIAALEAVPRYSEEVVDLGKALFLRLIDMFSKLSYGNIKLARLLADRDRLTEKLQQANLVVENSPVVLFRCKAAPGWPVELVSKNVMQFGYAPEEFLSGELTYSAIVYPRDLDKLIAETEEHSATGKVQWFQEYRIVTREGDIRWIIDETACERNEAGEITHYEGVIIDVTERRKAEEQLIVQQMQLRELNSTLEERVREEVTKNREKDVMLIQQNRQAALGEILDHIAHQWKQPLNAISLITYLLKDNSSLQMEEVNNTADKILGQVDHMSQTMNVFRDFYRPDKEKSVFPIKEAIERAISFIMPVLHFESIKVEMETDPELAALGYPKEFAQVILNLVSNARDAFMEKKVEKPTVIIRGVAEGEAAVVTVTDNAGGIREESIANIFDMNFTTKGLSGGTGIGLYMSRNIIERHMGGTLTAANVKDGAQFSIRLAIADLGGYSES